MAILDSLGIQYEHNAKTEPYSVDFLIFDNLVIECDGEYWHSLPGRKSSDKRKDTFLKNRGYKVLRLPESEILAGCETAIQSLMT